MANQGGTHEQHVKAGKMSHKGSEDTKTAAATTKAADTKTTGKQSGSHEQQSKAGQQSHKNKH